jgi:hypothetical protein
VRQILLFFLLQPLIQESKSAAALTRTGIMGHIRAGEVLDNRPALIRTRETHQSHSDSSAVDQSGHSDWGLVFFIAIP